MADADGNSQRVSIGRVYEIAFGWLGLAHADYEQTTLFQFNCRLRGYQEQKEAERRDRWEQTRVLIDGIWRTVAWKNNKVPNVFEVYPMPWDPKPEAPPQLSKYESVTKWYKFLLKNPGVKFNTEKMGLIEKHIDQLEKDFGKIPQTEC